MRIGFSQCYCLSLLMICSLLPFISKAQVVRNNTDASFNLSRPATEANSISSTVSLFSQSTQIYNEMKINSMEVTCKAKGDCSLHLNSSALVINKGLNFAADIFRAFIQTNSTHVCFEGLRDLVRDLLPGDCHTSGNGNDETIEKENTTPNSHEKSVQITEDIVRELYPNVGLTEVKISASDFFLLIPLLIQNIRWTNCSLVQNELTENHDEEEEEHHHDDHEHHEHHKHYDEDDDDIDDHDGRNDEYEDAGRVWGIALVSVGLISLLSVVGILTVPLMGKSRYFKILLSFLVSLAVGTLIGDALLHLLPHALANGEHKHESETETETEKRNILISLVAVLGIYGFFLFESGMAIMRKKKIKRKTRLPDRSSSEKEISVASPTDNGNFLMIVQPSNDEHTFLCNSENLPSNKLDDELKAVDSGFTPSFTSIDKHPSTSSSTSLKPYPKDENKRRRTSSNPKALTDEETAGCDVISNHQQHEHHHHHGDIANAQGIKDLAWMIIAGDGLHNFSDGLAIGAAFSSSIAAGLSTSLAIFCHELPHELGDFAILIDAGMSVKKALVYNGLCACLAFFGAVIGLFIGEYTSSVKLWILSVTAGGFLYVGLVDMLPQMMRQCVEKDGSTRFVVQNLGLLLGVIVMLLIAWFEESFAELFSVSHGH